MDRELSQAIIENGVGAALLVLALTAAVSVLRSPAHTLPVKVLWLLFVLGVPVAGPAVWFLVGRENAHQRALRGTPTA